MLVMWPTRRIPPARNTARRGMTLSETLIAGAILSLVLLVIALGTEGVRTELKRRQAIALLVQLDRALTVYHETTGQWPVDPKSRPTSPGATANQRAGLNDAEGSGDRVIAILTNEPAARIVLDMIPDALHVTATGGESGRDAALTGWGTVQDPWGRRLRCLTATSASPVDRKAVAANGDRPIFVSAGIDGHLGIGDISAASDNIRSDELPRDTPGIAEPTTRTSAPESPKATRPATDAP